MQKHTHGSQNGASTDGLHDSGLSDHAHYFLLLGILIATYAGFTDNLWNSRLYL